MPVRGPLRSLHVGLGVPRPAGDLRSVLRSASEGRFDFVAVPLAAPGSERHRGDDFQPQAGTARALDAHVWSTAVVGVVSEGCNPDAEGAGAEAEQRGAALEAELRWAAHLSLRGVLLPPPASGGGCRYARAVNELLLDGLFSEGGSGGGGVDGDAPRMAVRVDAGSAGWLAWNRLRVHCDHHPRLGVALEFSAAAAKGPGAERELERWLAEPVCFAVLPAGCFVPNASGFPVLPKRLKALLQGLLRRGAQVIFSGGEGGQAAETEPESSRRARLEYVARLFSAQPPPSEAEKFSASHLDCLQAPLQPLHDNLDSETYEVFETDPVKYVQYEEAVLQFLRDWAARPGGAPAGARPPCTVMVLGAGRGPLVAASLRASARAGVEVDVWAVEKNPNAVHTLRHRQRTEESWGRVQVVAHDMRTWQAPRKADAIVSELLGSFGDNELDPECLDGALRFLAEDGVSIPTSYSSSLAPVLAPGLWTEARGRGAGSGDPKDLETGYVVCIHKAFYPSSGAKDCFSFEHPNRTLRSNDRFAELSFTMEADALVHGFAGYFDCVLYGTARISIRPDTFSEGMFSWFPMFFPLQAPVFVRKGETLCCHWWRRHNARQVWYEWALSEPAATPVHNAGGRSWAIGLV